MTIYLAGLALIAAVAWTVARPFFAAASAGGSGTDLRSVPEPPSASVERWRKRRDEALASIRDADFDFQTGKLSETDYRELRARLDRRALEALEALDPRASAAGDPT